MELSSLSERILPPHYDETHAQELETDAEPKQQLADVQAPSVAVEINGQMLNVSCNWVPVIAPNGTAVRKWNCAWKCLKWEKVHWKCGWARVELDHQVPAKAVESHPAEAAHPVEASASSAAFHSDVTHGGVPKPAHPSTIEQPKAFLAGTKIVVEKEKVAPVTSKTRLPLEQSEVKH